MRSVALQVVVLSIIFGQHCMTAPVGSSCRFMEPVQAISCGLPQRLANFQGYYPCDTNTSIGKPRNSEDVQALIQASSSVKAVGTGHSWWKEMFCAESTGSATNIVMTEYASLQSLWSYSSTNNAVLMDTSAADFPISFDDAAMTVVALGGVPQRALLLYLAQRRSSGCPMGCTLQAPSSMIDQTVAGAIATGSHGSSLAVSSLSSQVSGLELAVANGTLIWLTPTTHPHLFKAAQVSVGRLGVITRVQFNVLQQQLLTRTRTIESSAELGARIASISSTYAELLAANDTSGIQAFLGTLEGSQAWWFAPLNQTYWFDFRPAAPNASLQLKTSFDDVPLEVALPGIGSIVDVISANPSGNSNSQLPANPAILTNAGEWTKLFMTVGEPYVRSLTEYSLNAYLTLRPSWMKLLDNTSPFNEYEVCIPLLLAGDFLSEVMSELEGPQAGWQGFRTPLLVRFLSEEQAYLSFVGSGPAFCINSEDLLTPSSQQENQWFKRFFTTMLLKYNGKMHWGKSGWTTLDQCFDGATRFADKWCHFGCAVQELDPNGKFAAESDIWDWQAEQNGTVVPFASCCSSDGFDVGLCTCAPRKSCPLNSAHGRVNSLQGLADPIPSSQHGIFCDGSAVLDYIGVKVGPSSNMGIMVSFWIGLQLASLATLQMLHKYRQV